MKTKTASPIILKTRHSTYQVHFHAAGYTAPSAQNPRGLRVTASGSIVVSGPRPARNAAIPQKVIEQCRQAFLLETKCVRLADDQPNLTSYPTVWLAR